MNYKTLLPFLILLLIGCAKVKDPEFRRVDNFHLKNFGLTNAEIGFNVTYYNPNNFGVNVKEAEADTYLDTVYLGKFAQDSSIAVGKNAEFSIPLSGTVALPTLLKLNLKDISQREVMLRADGNVKVGKAGIYISKPFHYAGKHRLQDFTFQQ